MNDGGGIFARFFDAQAEALTVDFAVASPEEGLDPTHPTPHDVRGYVLLSQAKLTEAQDAFVFQRKNTFQAFCMRCSSSELMQALVDKSLPRYIVPASPASISSLWSPTWSRPADPRFERTLVLPMCMSSPTFLASSSKSSIML